MLARFTFPHLRRSLRYGEIFHSSYYRRDKSNTPEGTEAIKITICHNSTPVRVWLVFHILYILLQLLSVFQASVAPKEKLQLVVITMPLIIARWLGLEWNSSPAMVKIFNTVFQEKPSNFGICVTNFMTFNSSNKFFNIYCFLHRWLKNASILSHPAPHPVSMLLFYLPCRRGGPSYIQTVPASISGFYGTSTVVLLLSSFS